MSLKPTGCPFNTPRLIDLDLKTPSLHNSTNPLLRFDCSSLMCPLSTGFSVKASLYSVYGAPVEAKEALQR